MFAELTSNFSSHLIFFFFSQALRIRLFFIRFETVRWIIYVSLWSLTPINKDFELLSQVFIAKTIKN